MKKPVSYRKEIPFFYNKSNLEFRRDQYERYDSKVVRHTALHLADQLWERYPFQPAFDFTTKHLQIDAGQNIVELGCSVGRWIGTLAARYPQANFWGLDFSYQMLKRANAFWRQKEIIQLNLSNWGFSPIEIEGHALENIQFGLAKAEELPFENETQDAVVSSFLLDRLGDPVRGLKEMYRVLQPHGKMIFVTPLNFYKRKDWETFHPPIKIFHLLKQIGFDVLDWEETLTVEEPLDCRGNVVKWNCVAGACKKSAKT
ncbi:MAG: class I SAM-dependent methyltransferase [Bacteroidota bacterium]